MDIQSSILGSGAVDSIAQQLGIPPEAARSGAAALLPAILGGFKRNAQSSQDGLGGLIEGLGRLGGGGLAADVVSPGPTDPNPGNEILGSIFGSKDVSRTVAAHASSQSGVSPDLLKRMLPLLAMLAAGYLASRGRGAAAPADAAAAETTQAATGGALGDVLGGIFGGGGSAGAAAGGLGGLASALDMDRDGNPLNDILNRVGGLTGR